MMAVFAAMSADEHAESHHAAQAEREAGVRRMAMGLLIGLLAEFVLGLATNLWVQIGRIEPWSHITNRGIFAAHAIFGAALAVMAVVILGRSVEAPAGVRLWATVGVVAVVVALGCGVEFVSGGGTAGWSFGMGLAFTAAVFAYLRIALSR
jgi:hypothetical protein